MSKKALEDTSFEMIKGYILYPDESALPEEKKEMIDRITSASKILDKNPVQKNAVALHQQKYPDISRSQAYEDLRLAARLFNSLHTFDFDLWRSWLLNSIVQNIQRCEKNRDTNSLRVIAMEHANLIKAIGERPEELPDPTRNEKHQFYILVQNDNRQVKIDINKLKDLPDAALQELNKAIWGGNEITEAYAEEIMKT
ncbi:MAG: hypothetical protein WCI31_06320 [Prolixibacteraceae bacterium]